MAFISGQYRKQITIFGVSGEEGNYAVKLLVAESDGASSGSYDFHLEGNATSFPSGEGQSGDIGFVASDETTLLSFWVEEVTGTTPNRVATIWIKVIDSLDVNRNIYCYYGATSYENLSDIKNTFVQADDFNDSSLDLTQWQWIRETSGSWDEGVTKSGWFWLETTQTRLREGEAGAPILFSKNSIPDRDYEVIVDIDADDIPDRWAQANIIIYQNDENYVRIARSLEGAPYHRLYTYKMINDSQEYETILSSSQDWNKLKITKEGTTYNCYGWNTTTLVWDLVKSWTSVSLSPIYVGITSCVRGTGYPDDNKYYNNFRCRKYSSNEPSFLSAGAEESSPNILLGEEDSISLSEDFILKWGGNFIEEEEEELSVSDEIVAGLIETENINNEFRSVIQELKDVNNKANTVIRVLEDLPNTYNSVLGKIQDIGSKNDFRTKALALHNLNNDIRFWLPVQAPATPPTPSPGKPWDTPGYVPFTSLGKEYTKLYIDSVEQTDIDIDSITITKILNAPHTASFTLGRAYDSTKPSVEASVEIKYHIWTLYKGYITNIIPGDSPDTIKILAQDDYWKENRPKKYFFVGHRPTEEETEAYYDTIEEALSTEFSWSLGIGEFVPQLMNCFGIGESDCITSLIDNSGNYAWYYDVNGNKKLWIAGKGNIITLDRQSIGENLDLYQVLTHSINEDISQIVNKLRVKMGNEVIKDLSWADGTQSKPYEGYYYILTGAGGIPDWQPQYEKITTIHNTEYGWDYHPPEDEKFYKDVFKRYKLPGLDRYLESWSDVRKPRVSVWKPWGSGSWTLHANVEPITGDLKEGFSIDYEDGIITFNEPIYVYTKDIDTGEITNIRAPMIRLKLFKSKRVSSNDPDDLEASGGDILNPLAFMTDKMGTYPETVIGSLELGGLGIQEGGWYKDDDGNDVLVPSWDDTEFAEDYADWQLSKTCDIKYNGNIDITLDCACQYNVVLNKRINIPGVLDSPLNIESITYNISNFTVTIGLTNGRYYKRTVSLPYHGE
jgi:hypothetical protein